MAFLRRLLGGKDQPVQSDVRWFDVPTGGSFEVAGVVHHKQDIAKVIPPVRGDPQTLEVAAVLRRDPANEHDPNAVEVLIGGRLVGYVPRASAEDWSYFLMRLEREGLSARATARVWVGESAWFVTLLARPNANYRTPSEEAAYEEERARTEAAKAAKQAERQAVKSERAETGRLAEERRALGLCLACGGAIEREPGKRGRPSLYCASCRTKGVRVQATKTAITVEIPGETTAPAEPTPLRLPHRLSFGSGRGPQATGLSSMSRQRVCRRGMTGSSRWPYPDVGHRRGDRHVVDPRRSGTRHERRALQWVVRRGCTRSANVCRDHAGRPRSDRRSPPRCPQLTLRRELPPSRGGSSRDDLGGGERALHNVGALPARDGHVAAARGLLRRTPHPAADRAKCRRERPRQCRNPAGDARSYGRCRLLHGGPGSSLVASSDPSRGHTAPHRSSATTHPYGPWLPRLACRGGVNGRPAR